jgi:hypothetical protein
MNGHNTKERRVNANQRSPRELPQRRLGARRPVVSAVGFGCVGLNFGYPAQYAARVGR